MSNMYRNSLTIIVILSVILTSFVTRASTLDSECSPKSNLFIRVPLNTSQTIPPALAEYPLIEEAERGYLIVYKDRAGNQTIALLPFRDRLGNPSVEFSRQNVQIRGQANVTLQPGFIPLYKSKTYQITQRSNDSVKVLFRHGDFKQEVWVASDKVEKPSLIQNRTNTTTSAVASITANDLVLKNGTVYRKYKIIETYPDGVKASHASGVTRIPYNEMSDDDRNKLGYNKERAEAFAIKQKEYQEKAALKARQKAEENAQYLRDNIRLKHATWYLSGRVFQVTDSGVLIEDGEHAFVEHDARGQEIYDAHGMTIPEFMPLKGLVFVYTDTGSYVDGDKFFERVYFYDKYQYTAVNGAIRTIQSYTTDRKQALRLFYGE